MIDFWMKVSLMCLFIQGIKIRIAGTFYIAVIIIYLATCYQVLHAVAI